MQCSHGRLRVGAVWPKKSVDQHFNVAVIHGGCSDSDWSAEGCACAVLKYSKAGAVLSIR